MLTVQHACKPFFGTDLCLPAAWLSADFVSRVKGYASGVSALPTNMYLGFAQALPTVFAENQVMFCIMYHVSKLL